MSDILLLYINPSKIILLINVKPQKSLVENVYWSKKCNAAVNKSCKAPLSTRPYVLDFYQTGKGVDVGKFV